MGRKLSEEEIKERLSPIDDEDVKYFYRPKCSYYFFIPPDKNNGNSLGTGKSRPRSGTNRNGFHVSYYPEYYERFRLHSDPWIQQAIVQYKKQGVLFPINAKRQEGKLVLDEKNNPIPEPVKVKIKICATSKKLKNKSVAKINLSADADNVCGAFMDLPSFANGSSNGGLASIEDRVLCDDNLKNIIKSSTEYIEEATKSQAPLGYGVYITVEVLEQVSIE